MSLINEFRTPEEQWQTTGNVRLVRQFYQEYVAEPEVFASIPEGSTIVLLPSDDLRNPVLTEANLRMAEQAMREGHSVFTYAVGVRPKGHPIPSVRVPWPPKPRRIIYNREFDTLTLEFGDSQPLVAMTPVHPFATAIFDPVTDRIERLVIVRFLSEFVALSPQMVPSMLTSPAELVGISREELETIQPSEVEAIEQPEAADDDALSIWVMRFTRSA